MENIKEEVYPDFRPAHMMLNEEDPFRRYGFCVYTHSRFFKEGNDFYFNRKL